MGLNQNNRSIDLNCDVGEISAELDAQLLPLISSCNVSCGAHAGDPRLITATVAEALRLGVAVGAHPAYPDRKHFGRRTLKMSVGELTNSLIEQISSLQSIVANQYATLRHIKPHGALYHDLAYQATLADEIAKVLRRHFPACLIYGMPGSQLERACAECGLVFIPEGFADRGYTDGSHLIPRTEPGAAIQSAAQFTQHFTRLLNGQVCDVAGRQHALAAKTLCLHSDGAHALHFVELANQIMKEQHVTLAPPPA